MIRNRNLRTALALLLCLLVLAGCTAKPIPVIEPTAEPTASPTVTASADIPSPSPTVAPPIEGLLLVTSLLVDSVEKISTETRADGTYYEQVLVDALVSVVFERVTRVESDEQAVTKQIASLNNVAITDVSIEQDTKVSSQLSYPTWRISYITGENEDTRQNVDLYIQTDGWDFRFHTSTPIDAYEDYKESIETWIESLDLTDSN